ncbi:MAG TPA: L,D-transpeptidase family protein [Actinomycetota bacterium]|nr:L,D-transpeptidase family protein [Actinomycetota bacterium]
MRKLPAFLIVVAVALALPHVALAQTTAVTLEASPRIVTIGEQVTLSGTTTPATAGQTVEIVDGAGAVVATTATDASGSFTAAVEPPGTRTYRAVIDGTSSPEVTVRVRATIDARMSTARLFDTVTVRGVVRPARPGRRVDVALFTGGRAVASRRVEMNANGRYAATFRIMEPGTYRARAIFSGLDLVRARAVTDASSTPLPSLSSGSRGVFVELLEERLVELDYRLVDERDGRFDFRTGDAVIAFHKVNRMARTGSVDVATWRALADPVVFRPEHDWRGLHLEVDQTRQVAVVVEDGDVTAIFHVSTGKASTPTRDGLFRVNRKLAGYSPNRLYYPSYFDGNRAFHGWPEVPTYAASHGCVRLPYWNALWVFGLADYGTRVAVYH